MIYIVGAPRCGTTSLYSWLKLSDKIKFPPIVKEGYFNEEYEFKPGLIYAEANPRMFVNSNIEQHIKPKSKIIILYRDPVERAFSHWLHLRRTVPHLEQSTFQTAIEENLDRINKRGILLATNCQITQNQYKDKQNLHGLYEKSYLENSLYASQSLKFEQAEDVISIDLKDLSNKQTKRRICNFIGIRIIKSKMLEYNRSNEDFSSNPNINYSIVRPIIDQLDSTNWA